jgi:dTDP-4-amino-4,6-dideoxygalactose transaminase
MTGATPVFADIDLESYTLDPVALEASISPCTAAVIPVHLFGCPADMDPMADIARQHDLLVLEDAAQAHGARYQEKRVGALGDAAVFGFYPSMNLGAYGDAGIIVTDDATLAEQVRILRHGGQSNRYEHELLGANSRLDEIQAAVLRAKLPHLDGWNQRRRALARRYTAGLSGIGNLVLPTAPEDREHVYHFYIVRTELRDALRDYLYGAGVNTGIHYPKGVHLQKAYAHLGYKEGSCPNTERAASQVLSLPVFPQLSNHEVDQVIRMIRFFFAMH